jgi:3-oxoacyl-[acyl-carrier protein] reductase
MESNNKVAIVTGASGVIGRAVAIRLARNGFTVVVHYSGKAGKAEEVVAEIKVGGGRAPSPNCAGIMPLAPIADGDVEMFDKVIATNLRGAFIVLGQAARHVSPGGRIIAFSTSVIAKVFPTYGPYIASTVSTSVPLARTRPRGIRKKVRPVFTVDVVRNFGEVPFPQCQ